MKKTKTELQKAEINYSYHKKQSEYYLEVTKILKQKK